MITGIFIIWFKFKNKCVIKFLISQTKVILNGCSSQIQTNKTLLIMKICWKIWTAIIYFLNYIDKAFIRGESLQHNQIWFWWDSAVISLGLLINLVQSCLWIISVPQLRSSVILFVLWSQKVQFDTVFI